MKRMTWKKFFESPLFFVAGIALLLLLSISLTRAQLKDRAIRAEIAALQAQATALEKEQEGLTQLMALLQTPQFFEQEARKTLGYVKPGEQVVVIEQQDKQDAHNKQDKPLSNPKKWWVYFFGS